MKNVYIISIGFSTTEISSQSVYLTKKDAIKALKENMFKWSKSDNCFINTFYSLTQCAIIEKIKLNEFNNQ